MALADWHFSLLMKEVTGKGHSQRLYKKKKTSGILNQQTSKDRWGHLPITAQMNLAPAWKSSLSSSPAVTQQAGHNTQHGNRAYKGTLR